MAISTIIHDTEPHVVLSARLMNQLLDNGYFGILHDYLFFLYLSFVRMPITTTQPYQYHPDDSLVDDVICFVFSPFELWRPTFRIHTTRCTDWLTSSSLRVSHYYGVSFLSKTSLMVVHIIVPISENEFAINFSRPGFHFELSKYKYLYIVYVPIICQHICPVYLFLVLFNFSAH